jgi:hypothetical protein
MKLSATSKKVAAKMAANMALAGGFIGLGAANIGVASGAMALTGVAAPVAAVTGAVALGAAASAAVFGLGAAGMAWAADDPPRNDYDSITTFKREISYESHHGGLEIDPVFKEICECMRNFILALEGCVKSIERCSGIELALQSGKPTICKNGDFKSLKLIQIEALRHNARECAACAEHLLAIAPVFNISWFQLVSQNKFRTVASGSATERNECIDILCGKQNEYLKLLGLESLSNELNVKPQLMKTLVDSSLKESQPEVPYVILDDDWYDGMDQWRTAIGGVAGLTPARIQDELGEHRL